MVKNKNNDIYQQPQVIVTSDTIVNISDEEFNKINNLYHFVKKGNSYYDKKRNKTVNTRHKSMFNDGFVNNFSKNWLKTELFSTKSQTLLNIVKNNPLLFDIYKSYCDKIKNEKYSLFNLDQLEEYIKEEF